MSTLMRGVRIFFLGTAHQRGHHRKQQLAEDIQEMKSLILSQNTSPSERAQIHNQFDPAEDKMKKAAPVSHAALHLFSGKEKT